MFHVRALGSSIALSLCLAQPDVLADSKTVARESFIVHGGTIITMGQNQSPADYPEAIWVKSGKIMRVGSLSDIQKAAKVSSPDFDVIDLKGKTLMPGFIEPHTHLPQVISFSAIADLSPCLPEPYRFRYYDKTADCPVNLTETFDLFNKSERRDLVGTHWMLGNGIDPSRFGNNDYKNTQKFINNPARYIEEYVDDAEEKPVFLLDQSGHVAYVNGQAFVSAGICNKHPCGPGSEAKNPLTEYGKTAYEALRGQGTWVVDPDGNFTGKLLEEPAYGAFIAAVTKELQEYNGGKEDKNYYTSPFFFMNLAEGKKKAPEFIDAFAKTGVTTIVNAGGFTRAEVDFFKMLAEEENSKLRYRSLVNVDIKDAKDPKASSLDIAQSLRTKVWDNDNKGLYGVNGIKIWADGSTQGCSAYLHENYAKDGVCDETSGNDGNNYQQPSKNAAKNLADVMMPYWGDGWLIQMHTNGDKAMSKALDAFEALQNQCTETSFLNRANLMPIVLHHATVGGDPNNKKSNAIPRIKQLRDEVFKCKVAGDGRDIQYNARLNITLSHTTGHVAYWGGAFQSILDGKGQADSDTPNGIENDIAGRTTMLDAAQSESTAGIPISFHSDVPITPLNPLWYVEQMVTRRTWFYPDLKTSQAKSMPVNAQFGDQKVSVYEALKAITTVPAMQNLLGSHIGSLEEGKVADLVILDKNPLTVEETKISAIAVLSTFVNGIQHCWLSESRKANSENNVCR